ncbi:MAG: hypothetical protein ACTHL7_13380 [Steroidobacteraceae bacterium]|jgi:hypothetical protein
MKYLIAALLMLSACSSQPVSDAGSGRHSVTATSTHGVLAARDEAVRVANRYCARSGQRAVVESFDDKTIGGVIGDPTTSAVFICGAPNTTAFIR